MNYIRHLHAFYQSIKNDESLSALHVTLYLALFQYWNYNRFQNPFPINRGDLMLLSKIKTKNSYHKCLKELHHKKFIIYHSSNSKFIRAKVSMIKLGLKIPEQKFDQLDLFASQNDNLFDIENDTNDGSENDNKNDSDEPIIIDPSESKTIPVRYQKQYRHGTDNDTGETTIKNPSVSKTIPIRYQNQYRYGIKNDTDTVSKTILLIKHKHKTVNSSSICYSKTVSEIFEKNKKIQAAISSFKNDFLEIKIEPGPETKIQDAGREKIQPKLKEVETFFLEKNFPTEEAQKFFYYNQSRNWMLNCKMQITDWHAMAYKWMLLQNEKKISTPKTNQDGPTNQTKQSANAAFLRDAKNDFFASATRSRGDHP